MYKLLLWTFILGLIGCESSTTPKSEKISLAKINELFVNLKAQGINTDTTIRWSYFFIADKENQFNEAKEKLKKLHFQFIEIYQTEDKSYWLHLERKEKHNAKSLNKLNEELYKIATKYKISYDGFDVENTNKTRGSYAIPEEFKIRNYQKGNFPYLLVGNLGFDKFQHKNEFCYFIKITTLYEKDKIFLLPTNEELEKLDEFEFFIENNLTQNEVKNYYIFRDTYKGIRNFYITTNDKNEATETLKHIQKSGKERQFNFEILTDKNWNIYEEFKKEVSDE